MDVFRRVFTNKWSTGLCACDRSCGLCFITICLPCITFGRIAEMVDEGKSSCVGLGCAYGLLLMVQCQCLLSCTYREKMRSKYGLEAEPCNDFCVHWCCEPCALCQEHKELKSRGLDPSKGWAATHAIPNPMKMFK